VAPVACSLGARLAKLALQDKVFSHDVALCAMSSILKLPMYFALIGSDRDSNCDSKVLSDKTNFRIYNEVISSAGGKLYNFSLARSRDTSWQIRTSNNAAIIE